MIVNRISVYNVLYYFFYSSFVYSNSRVLLSSCVFIEKEQKKLVSIILYDNNDFDYCITIYRIMIFIRQRRIKILLKLKYWSRKERTLTRNMTGWVFTSYVLVIIITQSILVLEKALNVRTFIRLLHIRI